MERVQSPSQLYNMNYYYYFLSFEDLVQVNLVTPSFLFYYLYYFLSHLQHLWVNEIIITSHYDKCLVS